MLHHRRPWTFVRSRNSNEQADTSHGRISRKSTGTDQASCCLRDAVQQLFGVIPPTDSPQPRRLPALGRLDHVVAGVRREQLVQRLEQERRIKVACKPYYSLSLLTFMPHSDDAELFHPAAERVRVEAQHLRRTARAVNDPT